jgi:hypothetical protein
MGSLRRGAGALIALAAATMVAAGCGGGSDSSADTTTEASAAFVGKGENGKLATFGTEADSAEREEVSEVLQESLQAREDEDFKTQCSTLTAGQIQRTEKKRKFFKIKGGCAKGLESQAEVAPPSVLANTMKGPVVALRVSGDRGFAFWHGTGGKDYAMPMAKEGGKWKVGSVVEKEVP